MWKKLISVAAIVCLAAAVGGCSADKGNQGKADDTETAEEEQVGGEIQITEDYTFTDPEDIEYDTRYVYSGTQECDMLTSYNSAGINVSKVVVILYAKDDSAVMEYEYFVFDDEASIQSMADMMATQGVTMVSEGLVGWCSQDADKMESNIISSASFGLISDETASAYTEIYTDTYGLLEYTE